MMEAADRTREFIRHTAERQFSGEQRCFMACADSLAGRPCACNPPLCQRGPRFDPCTLREGHEGPCEPFVPTYDLLSVRSSPSGESATPPALDMTPDAQARLLMTLLSHASLSFEAGYVAFTGGWQTAEGEEPLLRALYGVAHPE